MTEKSSSSGMTNDDHAAWLRQWFLYFQENDDYRAYCDAKRNTDETTCTMLEGKFTRIAQLYND